MSDNEWDDSDADDEAPVEKNPKLVKDLRAQRDAEKAGRLTAEALVAEFQAERRTTSLSTLFETAGKPGAAKFYPVDRETSPEAVKEWMTANADIFGFDAPASPEVPPEQQAAYQQISGARTGAVPSDSSLAHLVATGSEEDLLAAINKSKGL